MMFVFDSRGGRKCDVLQGTHFTVAKNRRNNAPSLFIAHLCILMLTVPTGLFKAGVSAIRNNRWPYPSFVHSRFVHAYRGGSTALDTRISEGLETVVVNQSDADPDTINNQSINVTKNPVPMSVSWRDQMPEALKKKGPKTFQKLQLGLCDIYILGTAHVSNESPNEVKQLLEHVQPQCIFVELCDSRAALLESVGASGLNATNTNISKINQMSFMNRVKSVQEVQGGSFLQAASTVMLTSVQEDYATELDVELGGEFRCAYAYWINVTNNKTTDWPTRLILGDRPMHLTLIRAWESLSWISKIKVLLGLIYSSFRKPNKEEIQLWLRSVMEYESDVLTESFSKLRQHFPTLYTTIIVERDAWLAAKLVQTSRALVISNLPTGNGFNNRSSIVAIVGAGHVPGICERLTNHSSSETPEEVISKLVVTKRWANDEYVQKQLIPSWINDVTQLVSSSDG